MEPIVWSKKFSVGIAAIDKQHKKLIEMINHLINNPPDGTRSETVADVLTEMTSYAHKHFESEETLMIKYGYPHLDQHKSKHRAFNVKAIEFCMATSEGVEIVPYALLEYLKQWLVEHILQEDMKYKIFFKEHGIT